LVPIELQWKLLSVITLGQSESDNINQMITISKCLLVQSACLLDSWDLLNLGQFDHINLMIALSGITLSGLHCTFKQTIIFQIPYLDTTLAMTF
jgi:hypothetical protein